MNKEVVQIFKAEKQENDSSATASADEGADTGHTSNHSTSHNVSDIKPMELVSNPLAVTYRHPISLRCNYGSSCLFSICRPRL